jgi:hypothetical protein
VLQPQQAKLLDMQVAQATQLLHQVQGFQRVVAAELQPQLEIRLVTLVGVGLYVVAVALQEQLE